MSFGPRRTRINFFNLNNNMVKNSVMVLGVVFILIGLLGFFNNPILGIFQVNTLHDIIHLASGILAVILAMYGEGASRTYAKVFGIVYALVTILGFLPGNLLSFLNVNVADNVLHLLLAIVLLYLGYGTASSVSNTSTNS